MNQSDPTKESGIDLDALRTRPAAGRFLAGTPWDGEEYVCVPQTVVLALLNIADSATACDQAERRYMAIETHPDTDAVDAECRSAWRQMRVALTRLDEVCR